MEKIITIEGKEIKFKSTGGTPLRYKAQFGKDFFQELVKLSESKKDGQVNLKEFDLDIFYRMTWILAKTGNPDIPGMLDWYDSFEDFPIFEIIPDIQDLIFSTIAGKKK